MAFDKAKLKREIERDRRQKVKARLRELSDQIKAARAARREAMRAVQLDCRAAREQLRTQCALRRETERTQGAERIAARRRDLDAERRDEQLLRQADRRGAVRKRSTSAERRQESDDEVRANIHESLVPVFDTVRRGIKGSPRKSRTEAFLQWAEENPGEVYAIRDAQADREVAKLLAEHARLERLSRKRSLAGVPF